MLNKPLSRAFYAFGGIINDFWWLFLIAAPIITGLLSVGYLYFDERYPERLEFIFVPSNGPATMERKILAEYWPFNATDFVGGKNYEPRFWCEVVIAAKGPDGNVFDPETAAEIKHITEWIYNGNRVYLAGANTSFTYEHLCLSQNGLCYQNSHVNLLDSHNRWNRFFDLTYPRANIKTAPKYVAHLFGGVTLNDTEGHFAEARGIRLIFYLQEEPDMVARLSKQWLLQLTQFISNYKSKNIDMATFNAFSLTDGMNKNSEAIVPQFAPAFIILSAFAVMCSYKTIRLPKGKIPIAIDWLKSKPILGIGGVITAGMAVLSGFGFILLIGFVDRNPIVAVVPFLILSIGVDDMFIMMAAWRRTEALAETCSLRVRIQTCLSESAVSITITSITDALSFGIGASTSVPAVTGFCAFTAISIIFCYIYQIFFFSALMVVCGLMEERGLHSQFICVKTVTPAGAESCLWKQLFMVGSPVIDSTAASKSSTTGCRRDDQQPLCQQHYGGISGLLHDYYVPCLLHKVSGLILLVSFILYMTFGIWGCTIIQEGLEPKNVIHEKSHAVKWYDISEPIFWEEGPVVQLIVNNPPNLTCGSERHELQNAIMEFENTSYTMAHNATHFWLNSYLEYLSSIGYNISSDEIDTEEVWQARLHYWITQGNGRNTWKDDMVWAGEEEERHVRAFRLRTGLRDFVKPRDHRYACETIRGIAKRFPEYNITSFHYYWPYVDQYIMILPNSLQNIGIALACMILITLLLIPDIFCAVLVTLSIVSIDIGVIGYMTWWNVNLDAVSMITIIMSVGFAVDLSAHISYAYTTAEGTPEEKGRSAVTELGLPILQGALSTMLGVAVLTMVKAYTVVTFFKTIFLVMVFGLLHGMVYLPVCLVYGSKLIQHCWHRICNRNKDSVAPMAPPESSIGVAQSRVYLIGSESQIPRKVSHDQSIPPHYNAFSQNGRGPNCFPPPHQSHSKGYADGANPNRTTIEKSIDIIN